MGLAICKEIVEAHGGTFSVDSRKGAGSTFAFALPVEPRVTDRVKRRPVRRPDLTPRCY
jgi:signal transduction histidine kinase